MPLDLSTPKSPPNPKSAAERERNDEAAVLSMDEDENQRNSDDQQETHDDSLALHPKIKIARKETHYFTNLNFNKGIDFYAKFMPHLTDEDQIIVEKTPAYFTSPESPKRVFEFDRNMKLILIVRNPVERSISDFTQVYYNRLEQNKTLPVFEEEAFDKNGSLNVEYKPVRCQ
ncbi:hypothetical protein WR25_12240 [Diploscapter pachys]|uniref:Sulfotransferase domain-containing protein n=1 Tax=Diploscapter pachys TaxID=2018661 RepID=A0A2A2KCA8_9BILA|nr:hypothetical protein WR25_12240 [Diploscapter pachys]